MNATPILTPSRRPSGRLRPHTYDCKILLVCPLVDVRAGLLMAIASVIERLEPGDKLWRVEFEIKCPRLNEAEPVYEITRISMPGREFHGMYSDGLIAMVDGLVTATCANIETGRMSYRLRLSPEQARLAKIDHIKHLINTGIAIDPGPYDPAVASAFGRVGKAASDAADTMGMLAQAMGDSITMGQGINQPLGFDYLKHASDAWRAAIQLLSQHANKNVKP